MSSAAESSSTPDRPVPSPSAPPTSVAPSGGLRASDVDRQQVADVLSTAFAEGRLTREEHDERLDQALAAKTFDDLIPITRDLVYVDAPSTLATSAPSNRVDLQGASDDVDRLIGIFGGATRSGRWRVHKNTQAYALFGGIDLDLREATLDAPVVEISGAWCFGGLDIKVPEGIEVRDQTVGIFGGSDISHVAPAEPGAPVLVIKGLALFGGVSVKTVKPKTEKWSRGDRRAERRQHRLDSRSHGH